MSNSLEARNSSIDTTEYPVVEGLRYLALGDSYTIGHGVSEADRFPAQTANLLVQQKIKIKTVDYIAISGWTTANLISAINSKRPDNNYDIVTLLIGVNDQYQQVDPASYRTGFFSLLNTAIALAAGRRERVVVLSIPDYSATPFVAAENKERVSKEVSYFNAINEEITLAYGVKYVSITSVSEKAAIDVELVTTDQLHPSAKQYRKWAELLAPVIRKIFK